MRHRLSIGSLLLFAPAVLAPAALVPAALAPAALAQAGSSAPQSALLTAPDATGCPVSLVAAREPGDNLKQVANPNEPSGKLPNAIALSLRFRSPSAGSVTHAELRVHGVAGALVQPASGFGRDTTESVTVTPTQASPQAASSHEAKISLSTVRLRTLTGVHWIELRSLTFADGTTWHETGESRCGFVPSRYQLTASAAQ